MADQDENAVVLEELQPVRRSRRSAAEGCTRLLAAMNRTLKQEDPDEEDVAKNQITPSSNRKRKASVNDDEDEESGDDSDGDEEYEEAAGEGDDDDSAEEDDDDDDYDDDEEYQGGRAKRSSRNRSSRRSTSTSQDFSPNGNLYAWRGLEDLSIAEGQRFFLPLLDECWTRRNLLFRRNHEETREEWADVFVQVGWRMSVDYVRRKLLIYWTAQAVEMLKFMMRERGDTISRRIPYSFYILLRIFAYRERLRLPCRTSLYPALRQDILQLLNRMKNPTGTGRSSSPDDQIEVADAPGSSNVGKSTTTPKREAKRPRRSGTGVRLAPKRVVSPVEKTDENAEKRKRGRPRKAEKTPKNEGPKRKRGRPPKVTQGEYGSDDKENDQAMTEFDIFEHDIFNDGENPQNADDLDDDTSLGDEEEELNVVDDENDDDDDDDSGQRPVDFLEVNPTFPGANLFEEDLFKPNTNNGDSSSDDEEHA